MSCLNLTELNSEFVRRNSISEGRSSSSTASLILSTLDAEIDTYELIESDLASSLDSFTVSSFVDLID